MGEVYIRSQDREKLYWLGGGYDCIGYEERVDIKKRRGSEWAEERHTICISDGCLEEIAEYGSKERCIEVLDEIQEVCGSYLKVEGGAVLMLGGMGVQPAAFTVPRVYQMPEK